MRITTVLQNLLWMRSRHLGTILLAGGLATALIEYVRREVLLNLDLTKILAIGIPVPVVTGILAGYACRRIRAGLWTFLAIFAGTLGGELSFWVLVLYGRPFVEPRDWIGAILAGLILGVFFGAIGGFTGAFVGGLARGPPKDVTIAEVE
jgi:hypothetical protein